MSTRSPTETTRSIVSRHPDTTVRNDLSRPKLMIITVSPRFASFRVLTSRCTATGPISTASTRSPTACSTSRYAVTRSRRAHATRAVRSWASCPSP